MGGVDVNVIELFIHANTFSHFLSSDWGSRTDWTFII